MSARGITIVSASAGSGKTHRLTHEVTTALDPAAEPRVPLEGLVAVTYTKKAHAELAARIQHTLVERQAFTEAMRLPLAYLGTVHAACLRLLQEFALDAGLSPTVDVVAEDQARLLRHALESALSVEEREHLDALAARFRLRWNGPMRRHDWLQPVSDIMDLARGNRIGPGDLPAMAERSAEALLRLFPEPLPDAETLDAELARELASAVRDLAQQDDGTDKTSRALELLEEARKRVADGELDWCDWAKLATVETGKKSQAAVVRLRAVASQYESHPQLHADLRALTGAIFGAARVGLSSYQAWKTQRRVVDYVDMLDGALALLEHGRVKDELAERLRFTVVDEFQDTSPIQLALFVELHKLTQRSVWVGDRKQCIFEYAGADPMLMDAVASWVARSGGTRDTLSVNYRSRPELVEACSELFALALERHGFGRDDVVVSASRTTPAALAALPPFGLWCLETKNKSEDAVAIAEGVRRLLADPTSTPVVNRTTGDIRPVRPGDIAVLVGTNAEARAIAGALHTRGLRSAVARAGLLETPEGTLTDAALRWLLDEGDSLAAATLDALTGFGGEEPDAWLAAKLEEAPKGDRPAAWRAPLASVHERLGVLSPAEALDETLGALDAVILCARWPDAPQRVANLDALRAIASVYEERCAQDREAATVAGLIRYFDDASTESLRRDEVLASDDQHVPSDDQAVIVTTYHKAKGLEWPVVVIASLDRKERRDAFEVGPETDRGPHFDPDEPLAGRWIRYWPWPFGQLQKLPLTDRAEASDEGRRVAEREDKERARLLYVGFTRARDHLVLALRVQAGKAKAPWLDALQSADGAPLLGLCCEAPDGALDAIQIGARRSAAARVWRVGPATSEATRKESEVRRWFARGVPLGERPRYRIAPSKAREDWPELVLPMVAEVVSLGGAMAIDAHVAEYDVLGDAVHAFLAADVEGLSDEKRLERARRLVTGAGLDGIVRAEALVGAGDRLRAFVEGRWPGAKWLREVPIEAVMDSPHGERRVTGSIDLLLETADGHVIIDHKTFPGTTASAWRKKAAEFLSQLAAYATTCARLRERPVIGCWVHFPAGGGVVSVA